MGYTLRNAKNQKAKDAYHVNLLDALHFVNKAISRLCSVSRQTLVESENMDGKAIELVEHFLDDLQFEADARLMRKGEMDAFTQHAELVCVRGPVAEQVLLRMENRKSEARNPKYETSTNDRNSNSKQEWGNGEGRPTPKMLRPSVEGLQHDTRGSKPSLPPQRVFLLNGELKRSIPLDVVSIVMEIKIDAGVLYYFQEH